MTGIYVRAQASSLITPGPHSGADTRTFELSPDHPVSSTPCAGGCDRTLAGTPVVMLPVNILPEDHKPTGYGSATAVLIHVDCLMPQPPQVWRDVVGAAQRLAATAQAHPGNRELITRAAETLTAQVSHALVTVLDEGEDEGEAHHARA